MYQNNVADCPVLYYICFLFQFLLIISGRGLPRTIQVTSCQLYRIANQIDSL